MSIIFYGTFEEIRKPRKFRDFYGTTQTGYGTTSVGCRGVHLLIVNPQVSIAIVATTHWAATVHLGWPS